MLNILIDKFEENFLPKGNPDQKETTSCLDLEWTRIMDPDFLEDKVISEPSMQWDYRALGEGFDVLVRPFMQYDSHIPVVFLNALRDFGADKTTYKKAIIILEYAYYAIVINDYFNFQKVFTQSQRNLKAFAHLTQIKYAGQFINTYPNYLLVENELAASHEKINALHQLLANINAAIGISRGVLVKWSHRNFKHIDKDMYRQNAINSLSNFFYFPIIMAAILAGRSKYEIEQLKTALSHLSLFVKLNAERKMCLGELRAQVPSLFQNTFQVLTFPGLPFILSGKDLDWTLGSEDIYPHFPDMYQSILSMLCNEASVQSLEETKELAEQSYETYATIMENIGLLPVTTRLIKNSFNL